MLIKLFLKSSATGMTTTRHLRATLRRTSRSNGRPRLRNNLGRRHDRRRSARVNNSNRRSRIGHTRTTNRLTMSGNKQRDRRLHSRRHRRRLNQVSTRNQAMTNNRKSSHISAISVRRRNSRMSRRNLIINGLARNISRLKGRTTRSIASDILKATLTAMLLLVNTGRQRNGSRPPNANSSGQRTHNRRNKGTRNQATRSRYRTGSRQRNKTSVTPNVTQTKRDVRTLINNSVKRRNIMRHRKQIGASDTRRVSNRGDRNQRKSNLHRTGRRTNRRGTRRRLGLVTHMINGYARGKRRRNGSRQNGHLHITPNSRRINQEDTNISNIGMSKRRQNIRRRRNQITRVMRGPIALRLNMFRKRNPFMFTQCTIDSSCPGYARTPMEVQRESEDKPCSSQSGSSSIPDAQPL